MIGVVVRIGHPPEAVQRCRTLAETAFGISLAVVADKQIGPLDERIVVVAVCHRGFPLVVAFVVAFVVVVATAAVPVPGFQKIPEGETVHGLDRGAEAAGGGGIGGRGDALQDDLQDRRRDVDRGDDGFLRKGDIGSDRSGWAADHERDANIVLVQVPLSSGKDGGNREKRRARQGERGRPFVRWCV